MYEILRTSEFEEWLAGLDVAAKHRVDSAIRSMSRGNWGDYKPLVGVAGVFRTPVNGKRAGHPAVFLPSREKLSDAFDWRR